MNMTLKESILDLSRQNNIGPLSPFFDRQLDMQIGQGLFPTEEAIQGLADDLILRLQRYSAETKVSTVVLGMSGGVDSALTAALFRSAGWRVIGVTMPINQNPDETNRGVEACEALSIEHRHIDLTNLYNATLEIESSLDIDLIGGPVLDAHAPQDSVRTLIRRGNIRARLRMITLYNLAAMEGGLVASTDNFSELGAGFWTLHGDVGDLSPIQSLLKSWEVPYMAKIMDVPESTWRATPTDGLGISNGDEAQLGGSYLEWDLMVNAIINGLEDEPNADDMLSTLLLGIGSDERATAVYNSVMTRMGSTWFKRMNPVNLENKLHDRYSALANIDSTLFVPASLKGEPEPITAAVA